MNIFWKTRKRRGEKKSNQSKKPNSPWSVFIKYGVAKLKDQLTMALATIARPCVWERSSRELISEHILQQTAPIVGACNPIAKFIVYAMNSKDLRVWKQPAIPVPSRRALFSIVPTSRSLRLPRNYFSIDQASLKRVLYGHSQQSWQRGGHKRERGYTNITE